MSILGIDEVGRGPWAGPLVVGACILPEPRAAWQDDLTDSKQLTPQKRQALAQIINQHATTALGWVTVAELDQIGLGPALKLATRRAVERIQQQHVPFTEIIIDGTINFLADTKLARHVTTLKKADLLIKEVSAASIVAKVARDAYMVQLAQKYPEYGFDQHMGYGTARHRAALQQHGPCPEHRTSFKPVQTVITTKDLGSRGETVVADYLTSQGHQLLTHNYKTKYYEIDLISKKGNKIYFTEVKYRRTSQHGAPLENITPRKLRQMNFAAELYLKDHPSPAQPQLAVAAVTGPDFQLERWFPLEI